MVVKITSNHLISGPPLHKISFSCSGGMQNKAFQDKTPTPLHESDAMAPRPIGRHQVMRLTHVRTKRIGSEFLMFAVAHNAQSLNTLPKGVSSLQGQRFSA